MVPHWSQMLCHCPTCCWTRFPGSLQTPFRVDPNWTRPACVFCAFSATFPNYLKEILRFAVLKPHPLPMGRSPKIRRIKSQKGRIKGLTFNFRFSFISRFSNFFCKSCFDDKLAGELRCCLLMWLASSSMVSKLEVSKFSAHDLTISHDSSCCSVSKRL